MKALSIATLACGILSIQGCSFFTNPKEQPIIEDKLGSSGFRTLATTPERRVVIFNQSAHKFCAEPPADVADNLASSFASALEGSDGSVKAKAEISKAFASTAKQLFQRSQGVQLYRDGMYSLCQTFINGAIGPGELAQMQATLLEKSSKLIAKEIPYLPYLKADNIQMPVAPPPPKLGELADEAQPENPTNTNEGGEE
jgi:hypothetical protein